MFEHTKYRKTNTDPLLFFAQSQQICIENLLGKLFLAFRSKVAEYRKNFKAVVISKGKKTMQAKYKATTVETPTNITILREIIQP